MLNCDILKSEMRALLSEQELMVLRKNGLISSDEVAYRDQSGNLIAENVMTKTERMVSVPSKMTESKSLLLDHRIR